MAKQSGLHQLRGKVGEHSYYRQTGIVPGLVRSINQGMSARVKTAPEFVNTRLNNAEFGQAGRIASVLGQFIIPKYRPMILPFSQSNMARVILEAIKAKTGNWGQRNLGNGDEQVLVTALNSVHKNNPDEFGMQTSITEESELSIGFSKETYESKMSAIGADGLILNVLACRPWIGTFSVSDNKYAQSFARANVYNPTKIQSYSDEAIVDYEFRPAPPTGWPAFYLDFFVVVLMPYRTINGIDHILQEHCSFKAFEVPED